MSFTHRRLLTTTTTTAATLSTSLRSLSTSLRSLSTSLSPSSPSQNLSNINSTNSKTLTPHSSYTIPQSPLSLMVMCIRHLIHCLIFCRILCLMRRDSQGNGGGYAHFDVSGVSLILIVEEVEGQTEEVIFDHLHATAFQYTPLGRTILGPAQDIKTITKDHLQNYIVIAASGAVKHEDIVEQVKKLFTKLAIDPTTASQLVEKEPAIFTGSEVRILDVDVPLAQFVVAFEGASWTDPDSIALMVMQAMLGSWNKTAGGGKHMGSELAQRVDINEVAESMMAFNTNYIYKDTGLFGVYAVAKPDCLDDLSYAIMYETTKLAYQVSEDDVTRARNQLKSSLLLHIDGTSPVAEDIGRQLLKYGRRISFAELFARIDAVDASTIKRVANRFIYDKDIAIAAIGPIQRLPDYNWFRRRIYWNRY